MAYTLRQLIDMIRTVPDARTALQKLNDKVEGLGGGNSGGGGGTPITSTDSLPEGSLNLYFTPQRVRNTSLTGLQTNDNSDVTANDTVLSGIGKLQAKSDGYGDVVTYNIGTSGVKVPVLSGVNTWSGKQTFSGGIDGSLSKSITINGSAYNGSSDTVVNLDATNLYDGSETLHDINLYGAKSYDMPTGGYPVNAVVRLDSGDIVKSTVPNNTANPNVDMTGWKFPSHGSLSDRDVAGAHPASAIQDSSGKSQQEINLSKTGFANQSFVSRLEAVTNNNQSYIVKRSDKAISFGCGQFADWGSEYGLEIDPDGLMITRGGFCNLMEYYSTRHNAINLVGSFITSETSTTANYATVIGDKFDLSFTGTNLTFQHYADYRGGMWDVVIDGGAPIRVKTYDPSTTGFVKDQVVATGLSNTTHTAVFTYAGKDPDASRPTHRGWFCQEKTGNTTYNTGYVYFDAYPKIVKERGVRPQLIAYNSIIEFAVRGTPIGTSIPSAWCPAHGTTADVINVSRNITREIYVDGVLKSFADIASIPTNINSLIVYQMYTAYCPTDTAGDYPLWDGVLVHKYINGKLSISHSGDVRTAFDATGYLGMFPTSNAYSNKLIMQDESTYVVEPIVGKFEFDKPMNTALFVSDAYKSAVAFETNVSNTLGLDTKLYENGQVFFEKRADSVNKVYWQSFNGTVLNVGDKFSYTNQYYLSAKNPAINSLYS